MNTLTKQSEKVVLSGKDYHTLLDVYQKLGKVLVAQKKGKAVSSLKTLCGIWQGVKIDEADFKAAEKSLFKTVA